MNPPETARDIRDSVRRRSRTAVGVCEAALDRLDRADARLHAFNTVLRERALARAADIDRHLDEWIGRPLVGVPVALKDNLLTRGARTTASSRMLEHYVPPYDATAV